MVSALARLFRISISRGRELIPIKDEIKHVRNYLIIQSFRYREQFTYEFETDADLEEYLCNKITLQPLVENAILHGILPTEASGKIWIIIQKQGGKLCVMVKDEGIGVSKEQLKRFKQGETMAENKTRKHIGVENVRDRIRYLYGEGFGIEIQSTQGKGTTVILTLPVKRAEEKER